MGKASRRKRERRLGASPSEGVVEDDTLSYLRGHRATYARTWSRGDARAFEADGHYSWMARFVGGFSRVFEVGVGDGRATLELLNQGHVVVGIDENPECLALAEARIRTAGKPVSVVHRQTAVSYGGGHALAFTPASLEWPEQGALLVDADLLNDPSLWDWATGSTADAVICWLMGTHNARERNDYVAWLRVGSSTEYRLRVENKAFEFADRLLRPGGVLHLVRRGEGDESSLVRDDIIRAAREQAATTALVVEAALAQRPYSQAADGVGCVITPPLGRKGPSQLLAPALFSLRAFKPDGRT